MIRFQWKYALATLIIFVVEVLIATVFKNWFFVRAYLGDVIVVMLIYTFVLSFFEIENKKLLIAGIFLFSVFIEVLQYFEIADILGFKPGSWQHIVLGSSFSWWDILCYAVGCVVLLLLLQKRAKSESIP